MLLRSIIIDDEETGIETLKLLIAKHISELKVVAQSTSASEGIDMILNYKPEIVFLDISMPEMNGFELLEKLAWKDFNLIFTTAHQQHGLKAIKHSALDYLLKPVDHRDLRAAINRVLNNLQDKLKQNSYNEYLMLNTINPYRTQRIGISSKDGMEFIDPIEIVSLESQSNYTRVSLCNNKTILTPKNLGEFESNLCSENSNFMRVHHSFIVNLYKVARFIRESNDIVMTNSQKIPLSKSRKDTFYKWLNAHS